SLDTIQQMESPATLIDRHLNFKQIMSLLSLGDLVIGMCLHGIILAAIVKVPFIALSYDPKIDRFVESIGGRLSGHIEALSSESLNQHIDQFLPQLPNEKVRLQEQIKPIIEQAFSSAELVNQIIKVQGKSK